MQEERERERKKERERERERGYGCPFSGVISGFSVHGGQ